MKKPLALAALMMTAACTTQPADVHFTVYPAKTTYPDGRDRVAAADPHPGRPSRIPDSAYRNPGDPESLLEVSSELATLPLARPGMAELARAALKDPPSRVQLNCSPAESLCMQAREIFDQQGIASSYGDSDNTVVMVYDRVVAKDCRNAYVNNASNPDNLNYPGFGCSVRANTVQMVSDKRQFVSPSLLDFYDGEKAVSNYHDYLHPDKAAKLKDDESLLKSLGSSR